MINLDAIQRENDMRREISTGHWFCHVEMRLHGAGVRPAYDVIDQLVAELRKPRQLGLFDKGEGE